MNQIIQRLKGLGYETVEESFYRSIGIWKSWYEGDVKKFHAYSIRNGDKRIKCRRYSLGMGKKLCEDWANLLMNEKVKITLEGEAEQAFVDAVFKANNFEVKANEMQELKSAYGTVAYIPRVIGSEINDDGSVGRASGITIDYVTAENIYPLEWENGFVSACAFGSERVIDGKRYLYLQIHQKGEDGFYYVENKIYNITDGACSEKQLSEVRGFERVPPRINTGSTERQYVIDRLNIANNIDYTLPMGIAVYANSIDVLKGVDIAYDSYVNEFVLGKKRIMVTPSASTYLESGEPVFDPNDVCYYVLPEDIKGQSAITPIDMTLRTAEHNRGINDQLDMLSSKCGFGENYYRFEGGSIATATQIVSEQSTLFRSIRKHETVLRSVLTELCRILLRLGNAAMSAGLDEEVEISIDFDDSIIEDKNADFNRDMTMMSAGILNPYEFRAKWMNEDEETAKRSLPQMEQMTDEPQNEVE